MIGKAKRMVKYAESVEYGLYMANLTTRGTRQEVQRAGRNISPKLADYMAGTCILVTKRYGVDGIARWYPLAAMFPRSLRGDALRASFASVINVSGVEPSAQGELENGHIVFCRACGEVLRPSSAARHSHNRAGLRCADCGGALRGKIQRGARLCPSCKAKRNATLRGYHNSDEIREPTFTAPNRRGNDLHIGAEIEIDGVEGMRREDYCAEANKANRNAYAVKWVFETDGSIHNGVETISTPRTWRDWSNARGEIATIYAAAKNSGGAFNQFNGLHFHIDPVYFGTKASEAGVKIKYLVNKFYDVFMALSFRPKRDGGTGYGYTRRDSAANTLFGAVRCYTDHSSAFNVEASGNTFELRTFGGEVDTPARFNCALDIVFALAKWAKNTTFGATEKAAPRDIVKYLHNARNVAECVREWTTSAHAIEPPSPAQRAALADFISACEKRAGV